MNKFNAITAVMIIISIEIFLFASSYKSAFFFFFALISLELFFYLLITDLRKDFQWIITTKDEYPQINKEGFKKFINHGYDPELGWVRKPNTEKEEIGKFGKTKYHIDSRGSRSNPGHEKLPKKISFYGDSFPFGRQVNDNETCQWYLSELTETNVLNFCVGNYGLDQSLLRLKREFPKNKTKVVVMGVVPSTIVRIMCMWKHYNEFGNTFGFKPRFILERGKLKLIKNYIDTEKKFMNYKDCLPQIRKYDYFYKTKFQKEMLQFPYLISVFCNPIRNIPLIFLVSKYKWLGKHKKLEAYPAPMNMIMRINLKLRVDMFRKNASAVRLLEKIIEEFAGYGKEKNFIPVFLLMPQKDDLLLARKKKKIYYEELINHLQNKMFAIDLTKYLVSRKDLDKIYSDDNQYGGHYSKFGNKLIAKIIYNRLKKTGSI
ncbi:hypothetical protein HYX06_00205 [Candidatus Woesearchaeota archaeon]|nr:hypothetical protein [Candidatus Woesearchaeota archaeon]